MDRLHKRIALVGALAYAALAAAVIGAAACTVPEPPAKNIWSTCHPATAATACPLDDGSFGQCHVVADDSVCAPFGACPDDLGDGGENGKPNDTSGACLWQCAADIDCPPEMFCNGVCVYEADDDLP